VDQEHSTRVVEDRAGGTECGPSNRILVTHQASVALLERERALGAANAPAGRQPAEVTASCTEGLSAPA